MFFFLSKTVGLLARPLVVITIAFILSVTVRGSRWKKRFFFLGLGMLLFFSNEFIANEAMRGWEARPIRFDEMKSTYDYGILLCGAAKYEVGPLDRIYIGSAADRINHTLQLYKMGIIRKVMVSGGSGHLIDLGEREADELASLLRLMGVPRQDILIENRSRNTHESSLAVKEMLEPRTTPKACLLITSASHIRRATACFRKVGWPVDYFGTDFFSHPRKFSFDSLFIPKLEALAYWQSLTKELAGYVAYWFAGYV